MEDARTTCTVLRQLQMAAGVRRYEMHREIAGATFAEGGAGLLFSPHSPS